MSKLQRFWDLIFSIKFAYKFLAYCLFIIFLMIFHNFLWIIILTFIFGYLFYSVSKFFETKIYLAIDKIFKNKANHILKKIFSLNVIIILTYLTFIWIIVWMISSMIPTLIWEISNLPKTFPFLADYVNEILDKLKELSKFNKELWNSINQILNSGDFWIYVEIYNRLRGFSIIFFKVILSLFLSFIFLLDRHKLGTYLSNIRKSNFSFLYREYKIIFDKVVKSFWVIIKAQATIALVNAILTTIWLLFIWYFNDWNFHYPYLITLSLIVFFAGFIPVLGTFISWIPIILIGYTHFSNAWLSFGFEVAALISIIHFIEAYFLNPKIVSKALSLPISITFMILLFSEDLFGVAWLLLGISLFYFLVGILSDIDKTIEKKKTLKN